jgi:hypothetical protein
MKAWDAMEKLETNRISCGHDIATSPFGGASSHGCYFPTILVHMEGQKIQLT